MKKHLLLLIVILPFSLNAQENIPKGTNPENVEVFDIVDQMPLFPGGEQALFEFLKENIKYPPEAFKKNQSGVVYIGFIIKSNGMVSEIKPIKEVRAAPSLTEEAIRVVSMMPIWSPGIQKGKPVSVHYNLPIRFTLNNSKKSKKNKGN